MCGEVGVRSKLEEGKIIRTDATNKAGEKMVIGRADQSACSGDPELRTIIIALKQNANVGLPAPANREKGEPG